MAHEKVPTILNISRLKLKKVKIRIKKLYKDVIDKDKNISRI